MYQSPKELRLLADQIFRERMLKDLRVTTKIIKTSYVISRSQKKRKTRKFKTNFKI